MKVDVSDKPDVAREAVASGRIYLKKDTIEKIISKEIKKGDPFTFAEASAYTGVKLTPTIIPLCHAIPIYKTTVEYNTNKKENYIEVKVTVKTVGKTGVEMEALVGVSCALNTFWDMVKYLEKDENGQYPSTYMSDIRVLNKTKGK
ncbi:MAG: cyclic pyranopterin monophosphate synthase MoaC [Candidatus Woesearchaeota archaeon]